MKFSIGAGLTCDLETLVYSKLLAQANSGGGKSWLLRRILEQTHGHVQHLIIDLEGEFSSLRQKYDYVHAAKVGADTAADPRSAGLLAERLLDLKVSAILDIYELAPHERVRFVKLFLGALVDAPKKLWHPALVVIDEAHYFCPEDGDAESAGVVKHFVSVSRKRGFCPILASQRLSKLSKDAAAECNNKLIGRTTLDVDMKRAAFELGMTGRDDIHQLRDLDPGEFFAYGPAFKGASKGVNRVLVGGVETEHPKAGGHRKYEPPPPTAAITKLLPNLADLPAEAEGRERTLKELKAELANTRRELTLARKEHPAPAAKIETKTVETFVLKDGQIAKLEKLLTLAEKHGSAIAMASAALGGSVYRDATVLAKEIYVAIAATREPQRDTHAMTQRVDRQDPVSPQGRRVAPVAATSRPASLVSHEGSLPPGEHATLTAALQYPGLDRKRLAVLTGYKRSSRDAYISRLVAKGLVEVNGAALHPTDAGRAALNGSFEPLPTGDALVEYWRQRLPEGERKTLEVLLGGDDVQREAIDEATGYKRSSRDAYLTRLKARGLVEFTGRGTVRASAELFE